VFDLHLSKEMEGKHIIMICAGIILGIQVHEPLSLRTAQLLC